MEIRPARPEEAAILGDIALASKSHWPYSAEQIAIWRNDLALMPEQISSCPTHVAQIEAAIVGFYLLEPRPVNWSLEHLWILPDYMGRGIGRTLLRHAGNIAAAGGAEALTIDADPYAEPF
jgi:ribosomal protein S18 acetylase RimI-like enzyme